MRKIIKKCLLAVMVCALQAVSYSQAATTDSVVKIVNEYRHFSWYTPWASASIGKDTGTGFVISKNRILTNAHVVSDSALLLIYFHNDPTPYPARVMAVGHDCDLAVLKLLDEKQLAKVRPLKFDGLPKLRSRVVTYGYSAGGHLISSTVGIVSRIECQRYVHAGVAKYLAVQTDAAINPGNSGGPVIQNGKVVGVAFQGTKGLENTGFFIPIQIINHFLTDIADGTYDGFPYLGVLTANLENPAARAYAGMKDNETGIRIDNIIRGSSADKVLQIGDIITDFEGYPVANNGTVEWHGLRLNFHFLGDLKQIGDTLHLKIIRKKKQMVVDLNLNKHAPFHNRAKLYDVKPKYYIYAGLVFAPLNLEVLKTYSKHWFVDVPQESIYDLYYRPMIEHDYFDIPHVVEIRRLDHEVNAEETEYLYSVIKTVNGVPVHTLQDLIRAFADNKAEQHVIRFEQGNRTTILDRKKADAANTEILREYGIPKDRSL